MINNIASTEEKNDLLLSLSRLTQTFNPTAHIIILPVLANQLDSQLEKTEHYDPLSVDQMKPVKDFTSTDFFAPAPLPSAVPAGSLPTSTAPRTTDNAEPLKPATELLTGFDPNKYLSTPTTTRLSDAPDADTPDSSQDEDGEKDTSTENYVGVKIDDGEIRDSRDVMQMLRELSVLRGN